MLDPDRKTQMRGYASGRWKTDEVYREKALARGKSQRRDPKLWPAQALKAIKARAKREGIPFDMTADDIPVPKECPVFKIPFVFGVKNHPQGPSVDKIIPTLGYISSNVRVISSRANLMKHDCVNASELRALADYLDECQNAAWSKASPPSSTPSKS